MYDRLTTRKENVVFDHIFKRNILT